MDFFNPRKRRYNKITLVTGYILMAALILLTTLVLLYDAYGYGFGKDGEIIQKGLVFLSSNPSPAQIYIDGVLNGKQTNSRIQLASGQYTVKLQRNGYRPWTRAVGVEGGSVEHFDYPFLFPNNLVTTNVQQYKSIPNLTLQSPDRRWLLVQQPGKLSDFYEYDLNNQKNLNSTLKTISIPNNLLTAANGSQRLKLISWSTDNRHILLQHIYTGGDEYVLFDIQTPADSVNLTKNLKLTNDDQLTLDNNKYDQYFLLDAKQKTLSTVALLKTTPTLVLNHVLAYKSYGTNVILYVSDQNTTSGKYAVNLFQNNQTYKLTQVKSNSTYLLEVTQYSGDWYVVAGAAKENKVYVYKNPVAEIQDQPNLPLIPAYILKVNNPNFVGFSANAQFILAESGNSFALYDAENEKGYSYNLGTSIASNQHATWMDGYHLIVSSKGSLLVWDYDGANFQTLQPAVNDSEPVFDHNYKWSYVLAPIASNSSGNKFALTSTAMRIPSDQ